MQQHSGPNERSLLRQHQHKTEKRKKKYDLSKFVSWLAASLDFFTAAGAMVARNENEFLASKPTEQLRAGWIPLVAAARCHPQPSSHPPVHAIFRCAARDHRSRGIFITMNQRHHRSSRFEQKVNKELSPRKRGLLAPSLLPLTG